MNHYQQILAFKARADANARDGLFGEVSLEECVNKYIDTLLKRHDHTKDCAVCGFVIDCPK